MKKKILMIAEQCNPSWPSVPRVAFNIIKEVSKHVDMDLVTHERNSESLIKQLPGVHIYFIKECRVESNWHRLCNVLSCNKRYWPIYHMLAWPLFELFRLKVNHSFKKDVLKKKYDAVHFLTPMIPRYAAPLVKACHESDTPLIIGPVNGGLDYPKGHLLTALKEGALFRPFRNLIQLLPSYRKTYSISKKIFCGSWHVMNELQNKFPDIGYKLHYLAENGISQKSILKPVEIKPVYTKLNLLFVGRLVPYKGLDMVIKAIHLLPHPYRDLLNLKVAGSGSEEANLKTLTRKLKLNDYVQFCGWLNEKELSTLYSNSDVFVFPSVREFGGAVILEAMAKGCAIVTSNRGGVSELAGINTGYKLPVETKHGTINLIKNTLLEIIHHQNKLNEIKHNSLKRAKKFTWETKASQIVASYTSNKVAS